MENQINYSHNLKMQPIKPDAKDLPNRDKVWNRVEEKLDQRSFKKAKIHLEKKLPSQLLFFISWNTSIHYIWHKQNYHHKQFDCKHRQFKNNSVVEEIELTT
jgi:hypothetical protein